MFTTSTPELETLGAAITTQEIKQQPKLWEDTYAIYTNNRDKIDTFISSARELGGKRRTRVVFTGAGTSQYVGDTITPYLRRFGEKNAFEFASVATTDIVSDPLGSLDADDPMVLVSFARSGNSPESMAAVQVARSLVKDLLLINITCAPEGRLAVESQGKTDTLTLLIPGANDQGFAMTGSFSCMALLATLVFDTSSHEQKAAWVMDAATLGREVISREHEIAAWLETDFERITYLGSGPFSGLAREAQLKVLELAAGKNPTSFDSSMGYRHGPKSFVDAQTLVFDFVANDPYTRQYDVDILNEISGDDIAALTIGIQQEGEGAFEGTSFTLPVNGSPLPAAYLALPFIVVAQTVALLNSVRVGNTPDTPSPSGTVNRVVKGVTIHPFEV